MSESDNLADLLMPGVRTDAQNADRAESITRREGDRGAREADLGRDIDPNYVRSMENFDGQTHAAIYEGAQAMMPAAIAAHSQRWAEMSSAILFGGTGFKNGLDRAISAGWEGMAADSAARAVTKFHDSCNVFSQSLYAIYDRVAEVGQAASIVKTSVPPPPVFNPIQLLPWLSDVPAMEAQKAAEEAAHREAVRIMTTHYQPTYQNAGDNVPRFTAPQGVPGVDGGGSVGPGGGGSGAGGGSVSGASGFGSGNGSGAAADAANAQAGSEQADGTQGGRDGQQVDTSGQAADTRASSAAESPSTGNAANDAASRAAGTDAAGRGGSAGGPSAANAGGLAGLSGAGSTGSRTSAGGLGSGGRGGAGGLGAGGGAAARGGLTPNSLPGSATGPEGRAGGSGGAAAGRAGAPGMGGMAPGARGKGDDDNQHKTPSYLINVDNGNELIGKMRPAAPPVLGADDPE